jgi:hypothetical protein
MYLRKVFLIHQTEQAVEFNQEIRNEAKWNKTNPVIRSGLDVGMCRSDFILGTQLYYVCAPH